MKQHPAVTEDTGAVKRSDTEIQELIQRLIKKTEGDESNRNAWLSRQATYYNRRYCRNDRHTDYPWPGAPDVVMPTIDMTIDRLKSTLSRVIFTRPMVTMEARGQNSFENSRNAEIFFNWLLNEYIPDFKRQVIIGLDTCLQYGHCVFKNYWHFETRNVTRILNWKDLPAEFLELFPGMESVEANERFRTTGRLTASKKDFKQIVDANLEEFKRRLAKRFELDLDEKKDEDSLNKLIRFFRNSEESVKYKTRELVYDGPRSVALDPQDFIVPNHTQCLQSAQRLTHRVYLSETAFKARARDHAWSEKAIDLVLDRIHSEKKNESGRISRTVFDSDRDQREGISATDLTDLIEIWESYFHFDIDNDGVAERVMAPVHPGTGTLLRDMREIPFEHGLWPFTKMDFELNDARFYSSRGVPEKIDDIDTIITERHRNKLVNLEMMVPTFLYRYGSEVNPGNFHFIPGEMYPVMNADDVVPLAIPDRTIQDEREENILLTWNQRYLGGLDTGLADQQNISEARTATEITAIQRSASEMLSFRSELIQLAMKDIYGQLWDLWNQWGPEEIYVQVTGTRPQRFLAKEIRGDFNISPVGSITTTDPLLEAQKSLARLNVLMQMQQAFPNGLPEWNIDIGEALIRYLQRENVLDAHAILRRRTPEEIQAFQQQMAQRQALIEQAETNQPMTIPEMQAAMKEMQGGMPFGARQKVIPRGHNGR